MLEFFFKTQFPILALSFIFFLSFSMPRGHALAKGGMLRVPLNFSRFSQLSLVLISLTSFLLISIQLFFFFLLHAFHSLCPSLLFCNICYVFVISCYYFAINLSFNFKFNFITLLFCEAPFLARFNKNYLVL